ncbi:hypothetical protein J4H39_22725 [Vibrio alginolyticus]|uniref:Uncharacterized protein n=2 Tax=Vibrio harveyi group TaxID=717610 RepID=A0A7Y0N082_VIBAL|nr:MULTISPECIES: hypothetical protein [Vibrio]EGQ8083326.1 hypothetical protein [Vibrio parahaemolyticus]EGR0214101.1 hypothetical protein [Vibrio parahaemolyticus]EGR0749064.1 hypothetical protein [Vibrio parahaemolyticus]EGR1181243.1 hypothetical protein [Vibrio parahaemolyticus]EHK9078658.1 hypothetical protein [Vibrio parahaemolyticus]
MSENIRQFDELVAKIFEKLYSEFPKQVVLNPSELMDYEDDGSYNEVGEFISPLNKDDDEFLSYTISWLYESGYLIGKLGGSWNSRVTLSLQGLQLLKSVPTSVESNESLGEQLKAALKTGSREYAANLVKDALNAHNIMNLLSGAFN